jgi:hypothetical protein
MPGRPEDKLYDAPELARNLIDWVDADSDRQRGGDEDSYYLGQDPPYRAANRALLTLDELRLIEGFDGPLVEALAPYLTVHPYALGEGINPNTAPPWVLAMFYLGVAEDFRLADAGVVDDLLDIRESGGILCADETNDPSCTPIRDALAGQLVMPPPTFVAETFRVTAVAEVEGIQRTVETVIDRSNVEEPLVLSWRVR